MYTTACTGVGKQADCQITLHLDVYNSMYRCGQTGGLSDNTALVFTTACTGVGKQADRQMTLHLYLQQHVQVWANRQTVRWHCTCIYNSMYRCGQTGGLSDNTALVFTTACTGVGKQPERQVTLHLYKCTTACTGVGKQPVRQVTLHLYVQQHVQVWGNSWSVR